VGLPPRDTTRIGGLVPPFAWVPVFWQESSFSDETRKRVSFFKILLRLRSMAVNFYWAFLSSPSFRDFE